MRPAEVLEEEGNCYSRNLHCMSHMGDGRVERHPRVEDLV